MKVRAALQPFGVLLAVLLAFLAGSAPLQAQVPEDNNPAIEKITALNKKALESYDNLEFEEARKLLKQALDMCSSAGLDNHPVAARTHIHMGVVLIAAKQQDLGVKQFKKAIEIEPEIQVTKALANPEIVEAFKEAGAAQAAGGQPPGPTPTEPSGGGDAGEKKGIQHRPLSRGKKGAAIPISATIGGDVTGFTKVMLEYRAEGATDYDEVEMRKVGAGEQYAAEIPASATQGASVSYYIEADTRNEDADPVATSGSEAHPYTVFLATLGGGGGSGCHGTDCAGDDDETGPPFFFAVTGGIGYGFTTGYGEINDGNKVSPGFAMAPAAQFVPEVGYFLGPGFRLSLQIRYQVVSGTTPLNLDKYLSDDYKRDHPMDLEKCGTDHLCSTRTASALAVLARATWFFGADLFRPYFSLALGGGSIRHQVTFDSLGKVCGSSGTEACVDTVLAGPIFAGPGAGVLFALTPTFGLLVDVTSVLGFPKFTYNVDLNAGVSVRL